jgi:hypothetical protein
MFTTLNILTILCAKRFNLTFYIDYTLKHTFNAVVQDFNKLLMKNI